MFCDLVISFCDLSKFCIFVALVKEKNHDFKKRNFFGAT